MSNISAGIGRGQIKNLRKYILARRRNNLEYKRFFENVKGVSVFGEPNDFFYSNHWLNCITINEEKAGFNKNDLIKVLAKDNIESRPLWKPLNLQPVFSGFLSFENGVAKDLFEKGLCVPSGSNLSRKDLNRIKSSIKNLL